MALDKKVLKELAALHAKTRETESEMKLARIELIAPSIGRVKPSEMQDLSALLIGPRVLLRTARLSTEWGRLKAEYEEMRGAHPSEYAAFKEVIKRQPKMRVLKSAMPKGEEAVDVFAEAMLKSRALQHTLHLLSRLNKNVAFSLKMQGVKTRAAYPVEKGRERESLIQMGMPEKIELTAENIEDVIYPEFLKSYYKARDEYRTSFKETISRASLPELNVLSHVVDEVKGKAPEQHELFKRLVKFEKAERRKRLERRVLRRAGDKAL